MRGLLVVAFAAIVALVSSEGVRAAQFYPGNQKYTQAEIKTFFENSGNPYLAANATTFSDMAFRVESGGNTAIYNDCCTGLMQMNGGNVSEYCQCTKAEYAAMSGQEQINTYAKYFGAMSGEKGPATLQQMQANGQTLGGKPIDAYTMAACAQLGGPNCAAAIKNGCSSTALGQGGDGHVNVCTMAEKARNGASPGEQTAGGSGTCLAAHPVADPVIYSEYAAWNRNTNGARSGKANGWHRGLDIYPGAAKGGMAPMGKPIYAAHDGKVSLTRSTFSVANAQFRTTYIHSYSRPDAVQFRAGQEIGKIGDNGAKGGPHLHFEVEVPGSAVAASSCTRSAGGESSNTGSSDCVFPAGHGGKTDPNLSRTMEQVKAAGPNVWFKVNPERYLKSQVPMEGKAAARTGRTQSLPNTCTAGPSSSEPAATASAGSERPSSSTEAETAAITAAGDGTYNSGNSGQASVQTNMDDRSVSIDMARQSALDIRSRGSMSESLNSRMDSAFAHMLLIEARRADQ